MKEEGSGKKKKKICVSVVIFKITSMGNILCIFWLKLTLKSNEKTFRKTFLKNETPFCTVNNDNFRDIIFEKVRLMNVKI